ncbi:MAG: amidohydrolase family protein, partial [SAR202 cluster bacterium]|nr:amidohydrolase family protein [SAR202 cluster bacterium]
ETAVPILVTLSKNDKLNFNSIVEKMANNPGQIINHISGLKIGKIKEGYEADLTIIDTDAEQLIDENFFLSNSTNSPITGMTLKGKVLKTIYRGEVVYES